MHPARSLVFSLATATALTFAAAATVHAGDGYGSEAGSKTGQPKSAKAQPHADGKAHACSVAQAFEQDRKAILAMAGEYHVTFQFRETVGLAPGYEIKEPYITDATEFVEVIEDSGDFISLQHVLVLEPKEEGGEPRVIKHWRQDWTYQDTQMLVYRGQRRWEPVTRSAEEAKGTWTQAVFQVHDAPRYEASGTWDHTAGRSAWTAEPTYRPLPRREYTKRSDYDVLVAANRHTITPDGWVHEQDNRKLVLDDQGQPERVLAHETGVNVYQRTDAADFTPGRDYWKNTAAYWQDVRELWADVLSTPGTKHIDWKARDDKPLYKHLFTMATEQGVSAGLSSAQREQVKGLITSVVTPVEN